MIRTIGDLRAALEDAAPRPRWETLANHLEGLRDYPRRFGWHLAQMLIVSEPETLRRAATRLLHDPGSRAEAALALARLHNRLEEWDALRALLLDTLDAPGEPRPAWLRMLLRAELLAPSAETRRHWELALPGQPAPAHAMLRSLRRFARRGEADAASLCGVIARFLAPIAEAGLPAPIRRLAEAGRVAIVGNGPVLLGRGAGGEIDGHDLVVRLNYPVLSGHEADTGRRTDLMLFHETKRPILAGLQAREPGFAAVPAFGIRGMPRQEKPADPPRLPPALERLVALLTYDTPTTGLFATVLAALVLGRRVTLYGFDFFAPGGAGHYFDRTVAAPMHEVAFERWFAGQALPALFPAIARAA
ncbi:glycosyltransferase family 29 protein [Falsiroseomonas sp. HW251]|uniref:glycosyltransferase family 29 protein n=1 Tax=Falsiroseomonas sp. HW251 TaxID=3390998 RepID=UPI003D310790